MRLRPKLAPDAVVQEMTNATGTAPAPLIQAALSPANEQTESAVDAPIQNEHFQQCVQMCTNTNNVRGGDPTNQNVGECLKMCHNLATNERAAPVVTPGFTIQQIIQMLLNAQNGYNGPIPVVPVQPPVVPVQPPVVPVQPPVVQPPVVQPPVVSPVLTVRRAVLFGINYIGSNYELNGCINDVNNVYLWLTKECGYRPEDIRIFTDATSSDVDHRPTRGNILNAFKWLQEPTVGLPKGTQVKLFVHYSGHGTWMTDVSGDEMDGRDEAICPEDYATAGVIIDDDIYTALVQPIAAMPDVQLTCVFDCCHSGTAMDLRYDVEIDAGGYSTNATSRTYKILQQKAKPQTACQVILLSGCLDSQTSADAFIERKAQGAMTWGFLETVRKYKADLSYKRLLSQLQTRLLGSRYEQIPHLSFSRSVDLSAKMTF